MDLLTCFFPAVLQLTDYFAARLYTHQTSRLFRKNDKKKQRRHFRHTLYVQVATEKVTTEGRGTLEIRNESRVLATDPQDPLFFFPVSTLHLSFSIWSHLTRLVTEQEKTIIITTHYIEEARQASVVGLMRHGRLLAEGPPLNLLETYGLPTLEEVFLKLCIRDTSGT